MTKPDQIRRHTLSDGDVSVTLLSLGCITQDWQVPLRGRRVPGVLGYQDPRAYLRNPYWMGVIAGRVANRISGAGFKMNGEYFRLPANQPPNHLHGGDKGLSSQNWEMDADGARSVQLRLVSPDGDQGYPGRLDLTVTIRLRGHTLTYEMEARSDRPTPVNLAQHSYYSLGADSVRDFDVTLDADRFTSNDPDLIPTGQIEPVTGRSFDFRRGRSIGDADPEGQGLDMNFVLNSGVINVAGNGLSLEIETDQPCVQLYTATYLKPSEVPLAGQSHRSFAGLCLEPQGFPNAINTPGFPVSMVTPDAHYRQISKVSIAQIQQPSADKII
ncbi:MAG: aldose epimerase family protein [Pseudomonadota bacterium]